MIEYFIGSSELMDNRLLLNIISAINDSWVGQSFVDFATLAIFKMGPEFIIQDSEKRLPATDPRRIIREVSRKSARTEHGPWKPRE